MSSRSTTGPKDMHLAIEAEGLVKTFGSMRAVDGVDLRVATGSVYGVLGPNGAGKTTTIKMLATLLRPDEGTARVLGRDIVRESDAVRGLVSLTGQMASVDEDLTGFENLTLLAKLLGFRGKAARARADELLAAFDLADASARQVKNYSGGMRRRLDIAASLVVTPELLILDEPTTGLDPRSRNQVWDIVPRARRPGHHRAAVHAVPRRGRPARRPHRGDRPGPGHRRGHPRALKASVGQGALHVRLLDPAQRPAGPSGCLADALDTPVQLENDPAA
jgi:ABC-2 type transport system ATP-binding protein